MVQIPDSISQHLFDQANDVHFRQISRWLPPFFSHIQVYEWHLSETAHCLDLSTLVRNVAEDREVLCRWVDKMRDYYPRDAGEVLASLAYAWKDNPNAFSNIHFLWLEFDLKPGTDKLSVPSLVAGFVPGISPEELQKDILHLAAYLPLDAGAIRKPLRTAFRTWEGCTGSCTFSYMLSRQPGNRFRLLFGAEALHYVDKFIEPLPDTNYKAKFAGVSRQFAALPGYTRLEINLNETGILPDRAIHQFAHLHPDAAISMLDVLQREGLCTMDRIHKTKRLLADEGFLASPHLLAAKVLYHGETTCPTGKAYFRHIKPPGQS